MCRLIELLNPRELLWWRRFYLELSDSLGYRRKVHDAYFGTHTYLWQIARGHLAYTDFVDCGLKKCALSKEFPKVVG
jgi:hypothetical protein